MFRPTPILVILSLSTGAFTVAPLPGVADTFTRPTSLPAVSEATASESVATESVATESIVPHAPSAEPLSRTESYFARRLNLEGAPLRQFGYDLFAGSALGATGTEGAVPQDYPLGPGDELIFNAPMASQEIQAVVAHDGTIFLPAWGTFAVSDLSLRGLENLVRARAHGTQLTVRLGRLRTMSVYLTGRVAHPGTYAVSALATVTNLLQQAGGVARNGSLRNIQLRRGGKVVATFDLYDFLLKGTSSGNLRLESGDILFAPTIGSQVAIAGQVRQPAIYELKQGTRIEDAVRLAGGFTAHAYLRRVTLERPVPEGGTEVRSLDLSDPRAGKTLLGDDDSLVVAGGLDRLENGVTLLGHLERPGTYEISPGTRVSQILGKVSDLKPEAFMEFAQITREVGPDRHPEIIPFNLGKALAGDPHENLVLQPRDTIHVFPAKDFRAGTEVEIRGQVLRPGSYAYYPHLHLSELIHQAGGLLAQADTQQAEITRTLVVDNKPFTTRIPFVPAQALAQDPLQNLVLERGDQIAIKIVPDYHRAGRVELRGEVARPGVYNVIENETLASVIERAGGYTSRAYLPAAIFTRESVKEQQQIQLAALADRLEENMASIKSGTTSPEQFNRQEEIVTRLRHAQVSGRVVIHLDSPAAMRAEGQDLGLTSGDLLMVPSRNDTVAVLGAVHSPSSLQYRPNLTVRDYLQASGGATRFGDASGLYVVRADGQVLALDSYRKGWWIFSHGLMETHLGPGDTIVIPERLDWSDPWASALQTTQTIAQILASTALLYGVFKK